MQVRKGKPPGSGRLARTGVELSREARGRLAWMDFYRRCRNVARTCRHFGISRQTFYRWQRRYDPYDLTTLEERSHCSRRRRQPTWSFPLEEKVLRLRLQFPRWGKDKLAVLLRRFVGLWMLWAHRQAAIAERSQKIADGAFVQFHAEKPFEFAGKVAAAPAHDLVASGVWPLLDEFDENRFL